VRVHCQEKKTWKKDVEGGGRIKERARANGGKGVEGNLPLQGRRGSGVLVKGHSLSVGKKKEDSDGRKVFRGGVKMTQEPAQCSNRALSIKSYEGKKGGGTRGAHPKKGGGRRKRRALHGGGGGESTGAQTLGGWK